MQAVTGRQCSRSQALQTDWAPLQKLRICVLRSIWMICPCMCSHNIDSPPTSSMSSHGQIPMAHCRTTMCNNLVSPCMGTTQLTDFSLSMMHHQQQQECRRQMDGPIRPMFSISTMCAAHPQQLLIAILSSRIAQRTTMLRACHPPFILLAGRHIGKPELVWASDSPPCWMLLFCMSERCITTIRPMLEQVHICNLCEEVKKLMQAIIS